MISSAVAILLAFFSGTSHALPEGDYRHQEKADVLYRTLAGWPQNTFDFHNGVYYRYVDSGGSPSDPSNSALHNAFEMTGITGTQGAFPNTIVMSTAGISEITVQTFKNPSGGSAQYWGAYTLSYTSIPRGLAASAGSTRSAMIVTAKNLKNRTPTPINYALSPGQKIFPNIYYNYIGTGTATGSLLEIDEIEYMRSDAFTEYCYAATALQIVPYASVYELSGAKYLQRLAAYGGLSPRRQFERLRASSIEAPSITVYNGTTTVADGGATFLTSLNVRVDDGLSGPERLEFYRDGSTVAVVNLNDTQRETTSYTYTSGDIGELGSLQNAQYRVRASIRRATRLLRVSTGERRISSSELRSDPFPDEAALAA